MSVAEIAHVRLHLRDNNLVFFNTMQAIGKFDQQDLGPEFSAMTPNNFKVQRSMLTRTLAKLLGAFRQRANPKEQIRKLQLVADSFLRSGQQARAIAKYTEAIHLALEVEEFSEVIDLAGAALSVIDEDDAAASSFKSFTMTAWRVLEMLAEEERLHEALQQLKGAPADARSSVAEQVVARLSSPLPVDSGRLLLIQTRNAALAHLFLGRIAEALAILRHGCKNVAGMPYLLRKPSWAEVVVLMHIAAANLEIDAGRSEEAVSLLLRLQKTHLELLGHEHALITSELRRLQLVIDAQQGAFQFVAGITDAEWLELMQGRGAQLRLSSAFMLAEQLLWNGEARLALRWINRAMDERKHKGLPEKLAAASIQELLALTMLGDWERLESAVKTAGYMFRTRKVVSKYTQAILAAFLAVSKHPEERFTALAQLHQAIDSLDQSGELPILAGLVDMRRWINQFGFVI